MLGGKHFQAESILYYLAIYAIIYQRRQWQSTLAWKIPWTEEPGWLQSMGSLRAGHE